MNYFWPVDYYLFIFKKYVTFQNFCHFSATQLHERTFNTLVKENVKLVKHLALIANTGFFKLSFITKGEKKRRKERREGQEESGEALLYRSPSVQWSCTAYSLTSDIIKTCVLELQTDRDRTAADREEKE